ncbi:Uma2 family endonuclease [Nostoc sp. CENA67]|uniref:Uma2 family endonuclease n=1 Tax=Amazonocrinis nigriterrae CENA67 TaxID=2794033 RepID=A0A8J7I1Z2_9NOST|nr:Uma2 family endonuclease [Amazonocrinis nigriterrae CENA67]
MELVKGRVVRTPMPEAEHGEVCLNAGALIRDAAKTGSLGRVMGNDTFVRVATNPDTYRGADVCFISYARLPKGQPRPKGPLEVPPDLVVEVRSPTDRTSDIWVTVGEYLGAGVTVVVVLDPALEAAAVYRQGDDFPQRWHNGDELTLPDVLPGFAVPVRRLFE